MTDFFSDGSTVSGLAGLEEDFFADGPPDVKGCANLLRLFESAVDWAGELAATE